MSADEIVAGDDLRPGIEVEVEIGPVAHGGHCVARYDGRVIFVRLGLPGERVVVRITEAKKGSFCRGEVVTVLGADSRRVDAPCSHFHPGGCGGCDFQHADADLQRELKATVVAEQLRRLAGLEWPVVVESLPGGGFGWRTRVRWALDANGRIGPRGVRSHRVEGVNTEQPCLIAAPELTALAGVMGVPAGVRAPVSPRSRAAERRRSGDHPGSRGRGRGGDSESLPEVTLSRSADERTSVTWVGMPSAVITEHAVDRDFQVAADGFWQPHEHAADVLAGAVGQQLAGFDLVGGTGWDLYGGVGLFAEVLCRLIGADGSVISVEADERASRLAVANLAGHPQAVVRTGRVEDVLVGLGSTADVILLDPPRTGAGPALCQAMAQRSPQVIIYVACDPAALGRDTKALAAAGYRLDALRAFDAFPQTQHIECVARYVRV